jgi:hypothetical protein
MHMVKSINIHGVQPYTGNCHLYTEISKLQTIMHTTRNLKIYMSPNRFHQPYIEYFVSYIHDVTIMIWRSR